MRPVHIILLAGLTVLSALLLAAVYAFVVEDLIAGLPTGGAAAVSTRWGEVWITTGIAALSVIVPVVVSLRLIARRTAAMPEPAELDYQAIAETAQDAIISTDATGRILGCNRVAELMFGYTGEELAGGPLTQLMPERYRAAHTAGLARASAGGETRIIGSTVELSGLRDDGEEFPLELSLSQWGRGHQHGYTGIIRDITERKRNEEALRQSEERLRKLVETAPDAVVVINAEGKIVAWNPAAQHVFGYAEQEAIGANVTTLMPERYRKRHEAGMQRLRDTGEARLIGKTVALHGLRKGGEEFPLELSLGTWPAGRQTFFSAIIRDVMTRMSAQASSTSSDQGAGGSTARPTTGRPPPATTDSTAGATDDSGLACSTSWRPRGNDEDHRD